MKKNQIESILVPIDFSAASLNALETALQIAKNHRASIILLHVVHLPLPVMTAPYEVIPLNMVTTETEQSAAHALFEKLKAELAATHFSPVRSIVATGVITEMINSLGETIGADLIVMGSNGKSAVKNFFLGSTTISVIRSSCCPVLIIPSNGTWVNFRNILLPVRDVPGEVDKYETISRLIYPGQAHINLLSLPETNTTSGTRVSDVANNIAYRLRCDGLTVKMNSLPTDNPAKEVQKAASAAETDLVVINPISDNKIMDYFFGSYVQKIITRAEVPILSTRKKIQKKIPKKTSYTADIDERIGQIAMYNKPSIG